MRKYFQMNSPVIHLPQIKVFENNGKIAEIEGPKNYRVTYKHDWRDNTKS